MTPKGKAQRAAFNDCLARENALVAQCLNRLSSISRPSCHDPDTREFCREGQASCRSAKALGLVLPDTYDCALGLSPYQAEYIDAMVCRATSMGFDGIKGGAMGYELTREGLWCSALGAQWGKKKEREEAAFSQAVAGLEKLKACWASIN